MTWGQGVELHECIQCGEVKSCQYVRDPYLWEMHNEEEWGWWCEDCFDTRAGDI